MADIRPFAAFRPAPGKAQQVASPPYDVLSSAEARDMARDNPLSFLHIVKAEIDLEPAEARDHELVYARSAANWHHMVTDGVMVRDNVPAFYLYRLTWATTSSTAWPPAAAWTSTWTGASRSTSSPAGTRRTTGRATWKCWA